MPIIRATAVLGRKSKTPRDAVRNVWHFATGANPPQAYIARIGNALEAFYDGIAGHLGHSLIDGATGTYVPQIEMATLTVGGAGSNDDVVSELFATRTMTLAIGAGANPMPSECAIALSFRGNVAGVAEESGVTRPKSRRRGRVFLGPLSDNVVGWTGTDGTARVLTSVQSTILTAYNTLVTKLGDGTDPKAQHVVYSPTSGLTFPVEVAHVDNAFDTIRSRGEVSTGRAETAVTQPSLLP